MEFADAVKKFFYFSMNYPCKYYEVEALFGGTISGYFPTFLIEVPWTCHVSHMISKWNAIKDKDSYGVINRFYAELDGNNKKLFSEWVDKNYDPSC